MSNEVRFYVFKAVTPSGVYSLKFLPYDATNFELLGPIQKMPQFQDEILRAMQKNTLDGPESIKHTWDEEIPF